MYVLNVIFTQFYSFRSTCSNANAATCIAIATSRHLLLTPSVPRRLLRYLQQPHRNVTKRLRPHADVVHAHGTRVALGAVSILHRVAVRRVALVEAWREPALEAVLALGLGHICEFGPPHIRPQHG